MKQELVLILDFGGQYNQLIARRVREHNIYCEVVPYKITAEEIKLKNPKGLILTGGPSSVYGESTPRCEEEIFQLDIPILGICYGGQLMAHTLGGKVNRAKNREYGKTALQVDGNSKLFKEVAQDSICWMSHTDFIETAPAGFKITGTTADCPVAAMENQEKALYAVQFHPEVEHTEKGKEILKNFLYEVCHCQGDWTMENYIEKEIEAIRNLVGDRKVLCALSGGVDSSVAAVLVHQAIGDNLTCVFVDHGLLRKDEGDWVEDIFRNQFEMNFIRVNAEERFLGKLKGVTDPELKRKAIGELFIRVFEEEAQKIGDFDFLVQGTLYPDIIESGTETAAVIKSHHNVGGLPEDMKFQLIEPFKFLFKDEVRIAGLELGVPEEIVWRQPFPGPGLAVRVLGEITEEKLHIVREADAIVRDEIIKAGLHRQIWQYFAVLPNIMSVGVMGDERTYAHTIGIRAITSSDAMTADWARIPFEVLENMSRRIVNEVEGANRIVYDITSKPPSTVEWE
ncbi:GMP synthase, large subunit [Alkaliphilus metalliredigens QYMF]|uniref:GMP synthase [glutamine-hydrolyzing] n=1 Tax=Alkaliphilus metalliredigens (strain QYMF) TaxID=293826 RepID=GUAA_ALKMQ|nr:glutamine-hydrolyzing GMP synthase [Alkaliphilus metalliredigens]A6TLR3.1 RecName: Full=GMP synthase [glutamine-hydrolyzing]; AltName: Full=GMP synthetase; AltName: Full=Glutamine amidotransferase [Alkaliphilus metalliredigens QYMF]ABR47131.1 GMP synthase, large subunit [Alkaliphilus metalliredigens QYMF]